MAATQLFHQLAHDTFELKPTKTISQELGQYEPIANCRRKRTMIKSDMLYAALLISKTFW
jgi:hypothetical protein